MEPMPRRGPGVLLSTWFCRVLGLSWACLGPVLGLSWACLGPVLALSWPWLLALIPGAVHGAVPGLYSGLFPGLFLGPIPWPCSLLGR
jgi:hypothetical protein